MLNIMSHTEYAGQALKLEETSSANFRITKKSWPTRHWLNTLWCQFTTIRGFDFRKILVKLISAAQYILISMTTPLTK